MYVSYALAWFGVSLGFAPLATSSPSVMLGNVEVLGLTLHSAFKQEAFRGIPFAEPPVGNLRLRPPVAKSSFATPVYNATEFGPSCL
ncbi:hypothetical protein HGRIS_005154 [Hohenbuehelia grisea]|uniref:Carboxylesterase type B domain-containing protein n=1 Tax=Hohenbuehelia grisea TaxID=104357 RepID=A0ABR3JED2_9AGAR